MPSIDTFAERLYAARKDLEKRLKRDLTQAEIGAAVGVHGVTYGGWESGRYEPKLEYIAAVAAFFGTDPAFLAFGEAGEPSGVGSLTADPALPAKKSAARRAKGAA